MFPWAHFRLHHQWRRSQYAHAARPGRCNIPSFIHILVAEARCFDDAWRSCRKGRSRRPICSALARSTPRNKPEALLRRARSNRAYFRRRDQIAESFATSRRPADDRNCCAAAMRNFAWQPTAAAIFRQATSRECPPSLDRQDQARPGRSPATEDILFRRRRSISRINAVLRHLGERGEDADLDCRLGLRPVKSPSSMKRLEPGGAPSTLCALAPFKKMRPYAALERRKRCNASK